MLVSSGAVAEFSLAAGFAEAVDRGNGGWTLVVGLAVSVSS
jgi:hypothetical protein